jgi:hypothetical protein
VSESELIALDLTFVQSETIEDPTTIVDYAIARNTHRFLKLQHSLRGPRSTANQASFIGT